MLRIIDANLNRLNEGLRLLEDVARFLLNDAALSTKLKSLRHELSEDNLPLRKALLSARDASGDVAALASEDMKREDIPAIVAANARRVTESLRVLEELAKLPDSKLDPSRFKHARFAVYTIERELMGKVLRREKRIHGLYVIIDRETLGDRDEVETCKQAIRGGAKGIQLRDKGSSKREILTSARRLQEVCTQHNVLFSVNDHLDVALGAGVDCLHLGQNDLITSDARRLIPIDMLLGCSTDNIDEALQAEKEGADYVSLGSIYPTKTKKDAVLVGLKQLRKVRQATTLPIVAIGGINADNIREVLKAGANAIAVISAVLGADDMEKATYELSSIVEDQMKEDKT